MGVGLGGGGALGGMETRSSGAAAKEKANGAANGAPKAGVGTEGGEDAAILTLALTLALALTLTPSPNPNPNPTPNPKPNPNTNPYPYPPHQARRRRA